MAVPNTINLGSDDPEAFEEYIASTMRRCFEIAGYFNVLGPDSYFFDTSQDGMTASTINFTNWYNVGAQHLIKTGFRVATNQAALDFRLFNVDTGQELDIGVVARDGWLR